MSEHDSRTSAPNGPSAPFASRYGLVRPLQGRYVAGVCAGLGRATRTDPVLWRVVLAVLVCFAGIGVVVYLALWLLTPEEGDTASPVEALLGRGHSNTSTALAVVLSVVAVLLLVFILPRPLYLVLLGAALVLTVLLLTIRTGTAAPPGPAPPAAGPPGAPPPPADEEPGDRERASEAPAVVTPAGGASAAEPPVGEPPDTGPPEETRPASGAVAAGPPRPVTAYAPPAATRPEPAGYQPPFAPHGPFAGPPPPPPPPPPERSPLPAVTFFAGLLVVGMLGVVDLAGWLDVPAAGYIAAALAVVGAGLVAGAWLGRARGLIALGLVLALALPVAHAAGTWEQPDHVGDITWVPQSRADLDDEYAVMFGAGMLDLRQVDLAGEDVTITVIVTFGDVKVIVPPDVPVEATVDTRLGNATVFGTSAAGVTSGLIEDGGAGDPDAGTLRLELQSRFANLEVHR
jgi:phage shock protein PspC (stress-responsive transcriptional regulator)